MTTDSARLLHERSNLRNAECAIERKGKSHQKILARPYKEDEGDDAADPATVDVRLQVRCDEFVQRWAEGSQEIQHPLLSEWEDGRGSAEDEDNERKQGEDRVERDRLRQEGAAVSGEAEACLAQAGDESSHRMRYIAVK